MKTIYSAENKLTYVQEYLQEQVSRDIKLYQPSKVRYERMFDQCRDIMNSLCKLLQQDELETEISDHFGSSLPIAEDDAVIHNVIKSVESMLKDLKTVERVGTQKPITPQIDSMEIVSQVLDEPVEVCEKTEHNLFLSPEDKRTVLKEYKDAIRVLCGTAENLFEKQCADLLNQWITIRFARIPESKFRYNVYNFPEWIRDIIYAYGYYIETNQSNKFISSFEFWLDEVEHGDNCYPTPYLVHNIAQEQSSQYVSLAGPVLWDMMMDDGLDSLKKCKVSLDKNLVYLKADNILSTTTDEGQLDKFNYYLYDKSVLVAAKLESGTLR